MEGNEFACKGHVREPPKNKQKLDRSAAQKGSMTSRAMIFARVIKVDSSMCALKADITAAARVGHNYIVINRQLMGKPDRGLWRRSP